MKWLKPDRLITIIAIILLVIAIFFFVLGLDNGEDFYANLATEFLSIAITVLVIDGIYRWRDRLHSEELDQRIAEQRKREIIEQMGSPVHDAALEAVRLAQENGWIIDGSLKGVSLMDASLRGAGLWEANLEDASLHCANLEGAYLADSNLEGADLDNANLKGADLMDANLKGARLMDANLEGAYLTRANLEGAYLTRANLEGARLMDANLKDARYSNKTNWPEEFDPQVKGAINADEK